MSSGLEVSVSLTKEAAATMMPQNLSVRDALNSAHPSNIHVTDAVNMPFSNFAFVHATGRQIERSPVTPSTGSQRVPRY